MNWLDWLVLLVPLSGIMALAIYSKRFGRSVVSFLAAGRVAGRYTISVGDVAAALSVITFVAAVEANYRTGFAMGYWNIISIPIGMIFSLSGYCIYRYRATKALSFGQFLELRYSHSFRITAATIRTIAEMITNALGPAIAANFFIYFLGLPHSVMICGINLPCFAIVVTLCLILAMICIWPAGRVSLLITDTIQGLLTYPITVMIVGFIILNISWDADVIPAIVDRVKGESFLNPFEIAELRDFNLFGLVVGITSGVLNRASWFGNDTSNSGRTPHEQKMAGILGTWRSGFTWLMGSLMAILVITAMNHERFFERNPEDRLPNFSAHQVRLELLNKVSADPKVGASEEVLREISAATKEYKAPLHRSPIIDEDGNVVHFKFEYAERNEFGVGSGIGKPQQPNSQKFNIDTGYIDIARNVINNNLTPEQKAEKAKIDAAKEQGITIDPSADLAAAMGRNAKQAQMVRSLYGQMLFPSVFKSILPHGLMGLFLLLMIMLLVSTDDSRIFNASSTIVQDVILPFMKKPPTPKQHIALLRYASLAVAVFFFFVAVFFSQLDYINMFVTIMTGLWLGGAGPVMIFGLYSRFGNTVGAWCSVVFGCGTAFLGLIVQRTWSAHIYPFLEEHGWAVGFQNFLTKVSEPFNPYIIWGGPKYPYEFAEKFPINSVEISFIAMILGLIAYIAGSFLAMKFGGVKPFNLDKLLHRGAYAETDSNAPVAVAKKNTIWNQINTFVGVNKEYTKCDAAIAWSVFIWTVGYQIGFCFLLPLVWNKIYTWPDIWWGHYYFITHIAVSIIIGIISTVWFMTGGILDLRQLFRDLTNLKANDMDNGIVIHGAIASEAAHDDEIDARLAAEAAAKEAEAKADKSENQ